MFKSSQIELSISNNKLHNFSVPEFFKSLRMSVSNNHVLIVITKMLHYHYEKERRVESKAFNSLLLQGIPRD